MQLLLRRDQRSGMIGKVTFELDARVEISEAEKAHVKKYKLGRDVLYEKIKMDLTGSGMIGVAARLASKAVNIKVTVDDLVGGKHFECKDIIEMSAIEEQLREACEMFKVILDTCAQFGGEEIIQIGEEAIVDAPQGARSPMLSKQAEPEAVGSARATLQEAYTEGNEKTPEATQSPDAPSARSGLLSRRPKRNKEQGIVDWAKSKD